MSFLLSTEQISKSQPRYQTENVLTFHATAVNIKMARMESQVSRSFAFITYFNKTNNQKKMINHNRRTTLEMAYKIEWRGKLNEPGHEKTCLMSYSNDKGADQPAHPRSLISAFVFRCLDSIISLDSIAEISRL